MEITDHQDHPIMQLRDDVLNFMEAIDAPPNSEINKTGFSFARLLEQLHEAYQMEYTIDLMESCFHCPSADKNIQVDSK